MDTYSFIALLCAAVVLISALFLVRKHNRTFIESSSGPLYRVSAGIIRPVEGRYQVDMESEVNRVELVFYARGHRPVYYSFKRTLGIGEYIFNVRLKPDAGWRDSYFLLIKPELTNYIVEPRFNMRTSDQLFLGEWMDRAESEM